MSSAAKLFMKLKGTRSGEIKGESEAEGFEGEIELDDWSWTLSRVKAAAAKAPSSTKTNDASLVSSRPTQSSTDPNPTTTEPSVFSFSKQMDRSSTALLSAMASSELLEAWITLEEASDAEFELVIHIEKIRVVEYKMSGKNDKASGEITEDWVFNYESIDFDYKFSPREGKVSVTLTRLPGASTAAASTPESEMRELARKFDLKQLEALWDSIKAEAGKNLPKPGAEAGKNG
jgi:type VI protein secretion system component Hcp